MKIKLFAICMAFISIQCTTEQDLLNNLETQNITYQQSLNLEAQIPVANLDATNMGIYVGTVVTNDLSFHEKVYLNLGNDGNYNAQIITSTGKKLLFIGERLNTKSKQYVFNGEIGSFTVLLNKNEVLINEASINNTPASISVTKSTSEQRRMPSLGTFTSNDGSLTGTWDFTFQTVPGSFGYTTPSLTIVRSGGSSFAVDITGTYQRLCSGPGTPVPIGVVNSSFFNIQSVISGDPLILAGADFEYIFVANRLEGANVGCLSQPSASLDITSNSWVWNGLQGTVTLDTSSLPNF